MKVLVTGGTGFVGSKLVDKLVNRGASVTCLIRKGISNPAAKIVTGDLTYPDFILPDEEYDVVYHLAAAWPGEKDKKILKAVNYDGTVNLFSLLKEKTKFIVYVSGLGVFGNPGNNIVDENSPIKPHTEYAKIRLEAQKFLESNCKELGIAFSVAYLGDVYGNGGWFKNILVERLKKGSFRLPGSGEYYRSFVHVDDVVSALESIAEKNAINQSFIVADSIPVTFKGFVSLVCKELAVKEPGSIPTILAKAVMGGDFVNLLTTSIKTSNNKIKSICDFMYKSYVEGIPATISEMKS
ncbi:NAD(P)-dependent oxidoreductase [Candidatus Pacearchaeota archaeon]|nr:NAD(P)-dependent oxidoreductase [Candidatus Pacearchaeota archaeon]